MQVYQYLEAYHVSSHSKFESEYFREGQLSGRAPASNAGGRGFEWYPSISLTASRQSKHRSDLFSHTLVGTDPSEIRCLVCYIHVLFHQRPNKMVIDKGLTNNKRKCNWTRRND